MKIVSQIQQELKDNVDLKYKEGSTNFFKEKIKPYGVRASITRAISRKYFKEIKDKDKKYIFSLCEKLFESGYMEEALIAFGWLFRIKDQFKKTDFKTFEKWVENHVTNWALCDDFSTHALGNLLFQYPELFNKTEKWLNSENRWMKRAAVVSIIHSIKKKQHLDLVFKFSDKILLDSDDLVQKGYGWLLKEASNKYQKEVLDYVIKHKHHMPRTALRYAIEKMPKSLKQQAMN